MNKKIALSIVIGIMAGASIVGTMIATRKKSTRNYGIFKVSN